MRIACFICSLLLLVQACAPQAPSSQAPEPSQTGEQWTQFRLNPQHDATLPGNLRVSWRVRTKGPFSSSPAVVGSTVYIGNNAGTLYALDLETGRVRWTYHVSDSLMSNPIVYGGLVIAGEGNGRYHYNSSGRFVVGSGQNVLFALDAASGAPRWKIALAGSGMPTPAIVDGLLIQHNGGGLLSAIDPLSGKVLYSLDLHSAAAMSAILPVGDGRFVTDGGVADAVQERNARTGALVWISPFVKGAWGMSDCPSATDGAFVFCNYNAPPAGTHETWRPFEPATEHAYAVDVRDGRVRWDVPLETGLIPRWNQAGIPLVAFGSVFFGSSVAPFVHSLDTRTGRVRWRLHVRGPVKSGIARLGGTLFFGDLRGYMWAVDARTGRVVGDKNEHTSFNVGSPVVVGRTILVGSNSGVVLALPEDDVRKSHDP